MIFLRRNRPARYQFVAAERSILDFRGRTRSACTRPDPPPPVISPPLKIESTRNIEVNVDLLIVSVMCTVLEMVGIRRANGNIGKSPVGGKVERGVLCLSEQWVYLRCKNEYRSNLTRKVGRF